MNARAVGKHSMVRISGGQNVKDVQITDKEGGENDKELLTTQRRLRITGEKKRDPIGSRLPSMGTLKTSRLPCYTLPSRPVDCLL